MRQFFKFVFASCLGVFLAFTLMFMILMIIGLVSAAGSGPSVKDGILVLDFSTPIPERSGNVASSGFSLNTNSDLGLHEMKRLIKHAQTDPSVDGIVYKVSPSTPLGMASASSLRESLKEFRDSTDKFLYTYGDFFDNTSYLLASSSDSIFANPNGIMDINGYGTMIPFFKGAMDKLGVDMNVFYAGQFKSATEPYRRTEMSDQNKFQTREYLTDNFELYLEEVTQARQVPRSHVMHMVNDLNLDNTHIADSLGLVDGQMHWYEFEDLLRVKINKKKGRAISYTDINTYASIVSLDKGSSKNKIAVIYAEGEVQYDSNNRGSITEGIYHKIFDKVRKDKRVKAVVLRVNSPGGSAFTSDVIWKEMKALQADSIPVIASFGDYAASGGYYIAASADTIVAHPKTLTGSIGVFSMFPNLTELAEDKLGITFDTVKTSPNAIFLSPFLEMNDREKRAMQNYTDGMYDQFLSIVAEGRNSTKEEIHKVAQGRVWTGQKAREIGLVDELGGLERAIEIAAEKAGVANYKLVEYPKIEKEFWEEILSEVSRSQEAGISRLMDDKIEDQLTQTLKESTVLLRYREPLARLPFKLVH